MIDIFLGKVKRRKNGSALMMILILSSAVLIVSGAVITANTKTYEYNQEYNKNDDLNDAANSALNIAKKYILDDLNKKKGTIKQVSDLESKYDFSDKVKNTIGDDGITYEAKATLDITNKKYKIIATATKDGKTREVEQYIKINLSNTETEVVTPTTPDEPETPEEPDVPDDPKKEETIPKDGKGIEDIVDKRKTLSVLEDTGTVSIKIADTSWNSLLNKKSTVIMDPFYIQNTTINLNSKNNVDIIRNSISGTFKNGYSGGEKIENTGVRNSNTTVFQVSRIDDLSFSSVALPIYYSLSKDPIGYTKKFSNGVKVVLINGDLNLQETSEVKIDNTIVYASGVIRDFAPKKVTINNSILVAGKSIDLFPEMLFIENNPSYTNVDEIKEFIHEYTKKITS